MNNYNNKRHKSSKFYFAVGGILAAISIILFLIFLTLPLAIEGFDNLMGWVCVIMCGLSFILFIFSIYLLKKGNFIRLNKKGKEANYDFEKVLDQKYKELATKKEQDELNDNKE